MGRPDSCASSTAPGLNFHGGSRGPSGVIAVGEPVYVAKGLNASGLERLQADMERRLRSLFEEAESALR